MDNEIKKLYAELAAFDKKWAADKLLHRADEVIKPINRSYSYKKDGAT